MRVAIHYSKPGPPLRCIRVLRKKGSHIASYSILLFGILYTLAYHILSAVEIVKDYNLVPTTTGTEEVEQVQLQPLLKPLFYTMWYWVFYQADILLAAALLLHIWHRANVFTTANTNVENEKAFSSAHPSLFPPWKLYVDGLFIIVWTALMIASVVMYNSLNTDTIVSLAAQEAYNRIKYARLAIQMITTFDIAVSSLLLWLQIRRVDNYVDKHITYTSLVISPLLLIRAFYLMSITIINAQPLSFLYTINFDALNLTSTILEGLLNYIIIYMFLEGATRRAHEKKRGFYDD